MSVNMECPCDIIGCQPSREWNIENVGRFVRCPQMEQTYIHVEGDTWNKYIPEESLIFGKNVVTRNDEVLQRANTARLFNMIHQRVTESCADHLLQPMDDAMMASILESVDKNLKPLRDNKVLNDYDVKSNIETWTTMKGVGKIRGLWNKLLNKIWGSKVSDVKWYHLLLGYELKATSFISIEPYLHVYNPTDEDGDGEFYHQIVQGQWTENAQHNASTYAFIQTPQMTMDMYIEPIQAVRSVNVSFTIKKEASDGADEKVSKVD